jgi:cytochrome c peroxidase
MTHLAPANCGGFNFSDATDFDGRRGGDIKFHNTGLYNIAGEFSDPPPNLGGYEFTLRREDVGKFKTPTLRNIALTAPCMHDGSVATLDAVLDHYSAGGRTLVDPAYSGEGFHNPNKDPLIRGFKVSPQERADLIAFLESLTDDGVLHDQRFGDPSARSKRAQ